MHTMQEHNTFPGKVYAVTCASGCTITDNKGRTLGECEAGKQTLVVATSDKLLTSADALVTATFNYAPAKLKALGLLGGGELYPGFDRMKYAACVTKDDLLAVNPDYMNDLTADGKWIYPLSELGNVWQIFTSASKVKKLYFSAPKMTDAGEICENNNVEYAELDVPNCTRLRWTIWKCKKVVKMRVNAPNLTGAQFLAEGCTNLRIFRGSLSKLSDGSNMFYGCQLEAQSVISLLNSLPSYTSGSHPITMGIHVDHQSDADVLAAIENAEAKGWTVAVQWNGTATAQAASTWGLRRRPIYAKVREAELPDGTTERVLDWGHYVTNAEENGYRAFSSVEEAEEELLTEQ